MKWKTKVEIEQEREQREQERKERQQLQERIEGLPFEVDELSAEQVNSLLALTEVYEENLTIKEENNQVMMAIAELYEQMLGGGE